jgi:hypothetical protein
MPGTKLRRSGYSGSSALARLLGMNLVAAYRMDEIVSSVMAMQGVVCLGISQSTFSKLVRRPFSFRVHSCISHRPNNDLNNACETEIPRVHPSILPDAAEPVLELLGTRKRISGEGAVELRLCSVWNGRYGESR